MEIVRRIVVLCAMVVIVSSTLFAAALGPGWSNQRTLGSGTNAATPSTTIQISPRVINVGALGNGYVLVHVRPTQFVSVRENWPALGWQWCWLVNPRPPECDMVICPKLPIPDPLCPTSAKVEGNDDVLLFFDRAGVVKAAGDQCGEVEFSIIAYLKDGTQAEAKGSVRLIDPPDCR